MKLKLTLLICMVFISLKAQHGISGLVTDATGTPLPGVNVVVKGTTTGAVSDFDGNYAISAPSDAVLTFSYIGFTAQDIPVNGQTTINVTMAEDASQLEEVVVIGYGTSTKKDLVSSVASVKSDVLENQPVARVDQVLQGRATGVEVTSNNGTPGTGATIRIRGNSSINGNNDPLYVVDGFIAGTGFNLNTINVNDIESIQILKDATALSIYGTRGASGVILITTKNGKGMASGKPKVTVNHYYSLQGTANQIENLGGQDFIDYKNESYQFVAGPDGFGLTDTSLPLVLPNSSESPTTNWLDLVEQPGAISNTDVSIAGNSEKANYFISANYFNQKGVLRGSGLERVNFRTNLDVNVSDRFKTGIRVNMTHYKIENNKVNYGNIVSSVLPIRPIYLEDGSFSFENPLSAGLERNPEADIQLRVDHDLVTQLIANAYVDYEVAKNLTFKSTFGAQLNYVKQNNYLPGVLPERLNGGFGRINTNFTKSILNENTLNYDLDLENHSLKILGGFTWQKNNNESTRSEADQFPNDVVLFNNLALGNSETFFVESGYGQRTLTSFLSRIEYGYKSKYLLTVVGRYDGSSVFETGNKYAFFPSAGVAWNIDEEEFLKDSDVIDRFKIRGSYGIVGEQGVDPYNSIGTYDNTITVFNGSQLNGVIVGQIPSNGLIWETTKQLDIGLELGFLNNRISFEADYYKKTTEDLLLQVTLPGQAGSTLPQLQNLGSVQNSGFEFGLNTVNVENDDFTWESNLSISTNDSEILELDGQEFISLQSTGNQGGNSARLIVGEALPTFVGATYLGTYKTADEIIADGREGVSFIGGPRYEDLNGDSNINGDDYVVLGSPIPDFYGGFRNTFTYKNLSLDVFFHGSYGSEIFNVRTQTAYYGRGEQNVDPIVLERWQPGVNETSDIPRAGPSNSLFNPNSSLNIEDGSFLRLKTMTLNYNIPLEAGGLKDVFSAMNVYVTGTNLWLLTDFSLGDPEVNAFTSASTNNSFGSVSQGFASGQYPYATTMTLGIKVEF